MYVNIVEVELQLWWDRSNQEMNKSRIGCGVLGFTRCCGVLVDNFCYPANFLSLYSLANVRCDR